MKVEATTTLEAPLKNSIAFHLDDLVPAQSHSKDSARDYYSGNTGVNIKALLFSLIAFRVQ